MRKTHRLAAGALAACSALAFAGSALASFSPRLVVSGAAGGAARIGVLVGTADDPIAKASIYLPAAYAVATPAPGTKLGRATATASTAAQGSAALPLTGELDALSPSTATTAAAEACGVAPTQTWNLHLTGAGRTLDIPVFVVAAAGTERAAGFDTKLVVCLPPPDVPGGTVFPRLLSATFTSSAITVPAASGEYRWTSLWTPYAPGQGTSSPAGSVEAQGLQRVPATVTTSVTRKRVATTIRVTVSGTRRTVKVIVTSVRFASAAREAGKAAARAVFTTTARGKKLGGASGAFTMRGLASVKLNVTAVVDSDSGAVPTGRPPATNDLFFHDLGASGCTPTAIFQGLPCVDATVGGSRIAKSVVVKGYTR